MTCSNPPGPAVVDDSEVAIFNRVCDWSERSQAADVGVRKTPPLRRGQRVTHLEPILTRADNLELRRDALDLPAPLLDLRVRVVFQSRSVSDNRSRRTGPHWAGPCRTEAAGVCSGEANLLEARDSRVLCLEIPDQNSI